MSYLINITRIKAVAHTLSALNESVVFVGGATTSLYAGRGAAEARPTDDVDVIIELAAYRDYAALEERLRGVGFIHDQESGIICRYNIQGITVDIMPTVPDALGFSNRWYEEGFQNAITYSIEEGLEIKIFSLPYFIASKLEAFKSRGEGDYRWSSDFEDIVYVLENSEHTEDVLLQAPVTVKKYLKEEFRRMATDPHFEEGLAAHLEPYTAAQQLERIRSVIQLVITS